MRGQAWRLEARRLVVVACVGALIGFIFGEIGWGLSIGLAIYSSWIVLQVRRVDNWFAGASDDIPEAVGVWGDLLDKIYRLQKRERAAQDDLRATIKRVQESVDALADGVMLVNKHSDLEWCNRAARRLLGIQLGRDIGQPVFNLIRDPRFKTYFDQKEYDEALGLSMPNRPEQLLQLHFTEFGRNDRMIIVRDVTRISKLERMRSDFVANVSHELKTPITVLRGYLEQMVDYYDELPERWHPAISQMNGQALRMNALITDLLTLSRLESEHTPKDQALINMQELIAAVKEDVLLVHEREINIETADIALVGSPTEVRSALTNLMVNAVKYTAEDKPITVKWRPSTDGATMDLQVIDRGEGISPEHLSRLTERFYRVDAGRSSQTGGTGLGLAIVKHIMLRHDGRLIIDSEIGRGSRFTCRFPLFRLRAQESGIDTPMKGLESLNKKVDPSIKSLF